MNAVTPHLPVLQVVVPLIGALLAGFLRRGASGFRLALAVSLTMPVIAGAMLREVLASGPISYSLGGWPAPWGIEYRVDLLNGFVLLLVSLVGAAVMPFARLSVAFEIDDRKEAWFYCMYLLCLTGLLGIAVTGDAFNAFVFLEISSLSSYVLIALGPDRRALLAAFQYLIMGTIGATFYVIGIGLLYLVTGSLNMADIAARLGAAAAEEPRPVLAALAFLSVGIGLKAALFPLHAWLPNAYAYAPSAATAFLSATATKVALYLLIRLIFSIYGVAIDLDTTPVLEALLALSLAAMLVASAAAALETDLKRMFAWSSVAQIGTITLGIGIANQAGLTGALAHLFNHAVMKAAVFLALGALYFRVGTVSLDDLSGIGRRMPLTMAAFTVAGFGIVGAPGTAGFISKWYLTIGALDRGSWLLVLVIVASSLVSLLYVGRVIEAAWFRPPSPAALGARDPPASMLAPLLCLAGATIWLGIDTSLTVGIAGAAAQALIGALK